MNFSQVTKKVREQYSAVAMHLMPVTFSTLLSRETAKNLDENFFKLLKTLDINSLIECGANEASASMLANSMGLKALAIEANPETFQKVTPPSKKDFEKLNFGLSDKECLLKFYTPVEDSTAGYATFKPSKDIEYQVSSIQVKRLDKLLEPTRYTDSPFALWIDVEGMQFEVLNGALETLKNQNCKMIKIEVEDAELFGEQRWLSREVVNFLEKLDYVLIHRDFENGIQYNLLFLRRNIFDSFDLDLFYQDAFQKKRFTIKEYIFTAAKGFPYMLKKKLKALLILLLGESLGNKISATFGSKSSQAYINGKNLS